MSNYALLTTEAQELLESDRKIFLQSNLDRIEQLQKEVALAAIVGIARKTINLYPEIRYVQITRPGRAKDLRLLRVPGVWDEKRNQISANESNQHIRWAIEDLLHRDYVHKHPAVESGEYDFVTLASRKF